MSFLTYFRSEAFSRGSHPPPNKSRTESLPIHRMPFCDKIVVPLSQHIGKESKPIVKVGEFVQRGQLIASADGWLSVPQHAPVTGSIEAIELYPSARGVWQKSIIIKTQGGSSQTKISGTPLNINDKKLTESDIVQAIWNTGMVGLGGATFPAHAKLSVPKQAQVHTIVVNGCECEPYLTCDHRAMLEYADDLIRGIRFAMKATGAIRAIIGIEDNKEDAVQAVEAAIEKVAEELKANEEGSIHCEMVPTKYPQGSEKMLLMALFGVEIQSGALPISLGMVVNNAGTLAAIGQLLPKGESLVERIVTVTGPGVKKPGNYIVPIGTPVRFILEYVGLNDDYPSHQIILGGPMMGQAIASIDVPITKGTSGVLVFRQPDMIEADRRKIYPCIKCGECVDTCPMGLNPSALGMLAVSQEYETMAEKYHLADCFECGCCTYVCPSNIPLVQQFRVSKQILRERAASSK